MIHIWKDCIRMLRNSYIISFGISRKLSIRQFSTKIAIVNDNVDTELVRTIDKLTNVRIKDIKKKPQKPPFVKNLFVGIFDTDILAYPEVLDKNAIDDLEEDLLSLKDFFENINNGQKHITQSYLTDLFKLKLIGLRLPAFDGGRQFTVTESCRYFEELSRNTSQIGMIDNEQLGIQMLLKHGNESHKKYLDQLIEGKTLISFCVSEPNLSSAPSLTTTAVLTDDMKTWVINGKKQLIVNGSIADLFIVFAESETLNKGLREKGINAFIVEKRSGGIVSTPCEITGLNDTDISNITFENTRIPAENLIGKPNECDLLISSILSEYRLSKGPVLITLLKEAINKFIDHCIKNDARSNILKTDIVRSKIGELTTALYAIESTTYLTSGLLDQYENQDCELECAIVKTVSAQYCHNSILKIMEFVGDTTLLKSNWCNQLYWNSLGHVLLNEPVDSLKLTIALMGLRHAGMTLAEQIKVLRNPLFHPLTIFKRMWTQRKHNEDDPQFTLNLHEYLHPSIVGGAKFLEYSVLRLQFATEILLSRDGSDAISKHIDLIRLADCICDIYTMTAVLGRASRAYCIGLRHADIEMEIAAGFAKKAMERVRSNVSNIWNGHYVNADEKYLNIGKHAIRQKEYFPVHPLSRNF